MKNIIHSVIHVLFISIASVHYGISFAATGFSIEEPLDNQIPIPSSIISDLSNKIDIQKYGCTESKISQTLEATKISLSSSSHEVLVKPKASCICGANYCPVWIYQINKKSTKLIWSSPGTGYIEILDKKNKRYKQIRDGGGTAGHDHEEIWAWNGKKYLQTKNNRQK